MTIRRWYIINNFLYQVFMSQNTSYIAFLYQGFGCRPYNPFSPALWATHGEGLVLIKRYEEIKNSKEAKCNDWHKDHRCNLR